MCHKVETEPWQSIFEFGIKDNLRKWQQPLQKKKERAKRYKTNEVKKKQMTLSAAGMSHDGEGGGGGARQVWRFRQECKTTILMSFFIKMKHIY